ncbi:uncharacterized protein LOC110254512 [Exaiptasia diaphana]|uniref:BZIP domain-containing protein n=1 Tax=Exaiptasia diaphana TaxID=2652724 RepID=A0A913YYX5_EXADI|nr:uncharacterized protein LOC110254512 [Exaiptasia diaphana]XP_020917182.1 uncharacterized protein LOC110254512 [Exaiptasia diaphana]XP_028519647.1 uncharacterized protein LOC110254512 [Exaiptasia diaphana]KXJ05981.1 Cyclic AMP-responsive element-binding protein 3-like protein 1 [Exaiptasia diaphana]
MAVYTDMAALYNTYNDMHTGMNGDLRHLNNTTDSTENGKTSLIARANKEDAKVLFQISYLLDKKKQQKNKKNVDSQSTDVKTGYVTKHCDPDIMAYGTSSVSHTNYTHTQVNINEDTYNNVNKPEDNQYEPFPVPLQEPPRNKSEERALKRIRRKIKNKLSAQESRRKKKEYLENLEKTVVSCTSENGVLKEQVSSLNHTVR